MARAALARRHAADHPGAVGDRLLGMEGALRAGEALADDLGVADRPGPPSGCLSDRGHDLLGGVARDRSPAVIARPDSLRICLPSSTLVPSRRTTSGTPRLTSRAAATTPSAITSQRMMPPKMLTRMPSTLGSDEDELEGRGHPLLGGAAADVEEVGRRAAVQLDDVHRRHRQAGAVDHAADVAVELDVVELVPAASSSFGSSSSTSRSSTTRGWRKSALSSKLILASSATSSPAPVTTSGLISTRQASSSMKAR